MNAQANRVRTVELATMASIATAVVVLRATLVVTVWNQLMNVEAAPAKTVPPVPAAS
eukprot:SAG11_NODE_3916_length_2150_cov_1.076060_3_plen_56_part_01